MQFSIPFIYRVLSADQINTFLFEKLGLDAIFYGTDVDGLFTDDPKKNPNAMLIRRVDDSNYQSVINLSSSSFNLDVTQGMRGKLEEIHEVQVRPVKSIIYNALIKGNTYRVLSGEAVGTTVSFED